MKRPGMCNTILPLVFDDSLSYYEVISKIMYTVNQLIEASTGDINAAIEKYIDEHFNDLMIMAIYDEKTETIILRTGTLTGGLNNG